MYDYKKEKQRIFTEEGQVAFIKIRDKAKSLLESSGSFRIDALMTVLSGDTNIMLACVDRMVELGEIRELTQEKYVWGQHRIFTTTN